MTKLGQSSFRRILLSRLLLVSVPILLIGVYFTYRKARSAILYTARQNITESAIAKGKSIDKSVNILRAELIIASGNEVLQNDSGADIQNFIKQLERDLFTNIQCIQVIDATKRTTAASTCGQKVLADFTNHAWAGKTSSPVYIKSVVNSSPPVINENPDFSIRISQLELLFCVPVYNNQNQLKQILVVKSALLQQEQVKPGLLTGNPGVINQQGIILAYPYPEVIGQNINQQKDAPNWKKLVANALNQQSGFSLLFSPQKPSLELLSGYTAIASPVTEEKGQKWIVLDVTPVEEALAGLKDVRLVLLIMTCTLIAGVVVATLYISRDLAKPLEKLSDTTFHKDNWQGENLVISDFKIKEYNQLAAILNEREIKLKTWGQELEIAWKNAEAADRIKNEFLMTISHELRTPLNGIIGSLNLIMEGFCDDHEEETEFLQEANSSAVRLLSIISNILEIASMEKGELTVDLAKVSLNSILNRVIVEHLPKINHKGIKINYPQLKEELSIQADPIKLKKVFDHIIDNAIKFTSRGSIAIKVLSDFVDDQSKHKVIVTIKDTGIGIDIDSQSKLFQPFIMVDGTTTRQYGGVGLGLAISRNLVESMGGEIQISSSGRGKGVTVEIHLPLAT
ncbi:MAG: ATP-binding protein [Spirulinaceae cyanobacterium]